MTTMQESVSPALFVYRTEVWCGRQLLTACLSLLLVIVAAVLPSVGQAQNTGQWSTLTYTMPINPVHAALLNNGKVLVVAGSGNYPANLTNGILQAAVWDPATGTISVQNVGWDMFCNGMVGLPDGREFVFGGTLQYDPFHGLATTATFDPSTSNFINQQSMAHGRWYPTGLVLGNGLVMVFSGSDENGNTNKAVELYTPNTGWSTQYLAGWTPPLYPRLHLLPNGKVFYSGPGTSSALFDPIAHTWQTNVANTNYAGVRTYGTSVLLPLTPQNGYTPKVMIMGGGNPATNTTEIINLSAATPAWAYSTPMSEARIEMNAVLLPTGTVLAVGGSVNDEDSSTASLAADLFDPVAQTMKSAGSEAYARLYHSVSLLLPDATVWVAGGNPVRGTYETHMEIYQPAYLFTTNSFGQTVPATRPTITSVPASAYYGSTFQVQTPDAASISSVVLIRNGSVTHAFNMDQRMVGLSFTAGSGVLTASVPSNTNILPPGYYMLFLVNNSGVPSVAKFVHIGASSPPPNGITFVQVNAATPQSSTASVPVAYRSSQTAGDLNVVVVGWNDATSSISSVTDSAGNSYALAVGPTRGTAMTQAIYYAKNIAGGSNTVTVAFNSAASNPDVRILEYNDVDTTAPLDGTAAAAGSSNTANSGSATTSNANDLIVGADTVYTGNLGPGPAFTARIITSPDSDLAEDRVVTAAGSYNATAPLSASGNWVMQMAAFRQKASNTNPAPSVTSVSPNSGPTGGGTAVSISGSNFLAGASVSFGGTAAGSVTVVNSSTITATTPAHAAGAVSVVVTNSDGQSGTLASGFTYTSTSGSISFVQVAAATPQSSLQTVAVGYSLAQTAGDLNIVVVGWNDATSSVSSVTDSAGNSYALAIGPTSGVNLRQSIYYARNIRGGANTVTVSFNQAAAFPDVRVLEYRGLNTTSPLDAAHGASGNSATANSGAAATTAATELIFGADMVYTGNKTPGSGFTARIITSPDSDLAEDQTVSSTGSYAATATLTASGNWVMQVATFKP